MRDEVDILIIGGGLSGLSAAYQLRDLDILVLEKEGREGGLCRSNYVDGFIFDMAGHMLHIGEGWLRAFIGSIMEVGLRIHRRRSFVYMMDRMIPYPFQMNFWMIPEIAEECMEGLMRARGGGTGEDEGFESWIRRRFGEGIAKHFMIPYNKKLWRVELEGMTSEWAEKFIPIPELGKILQMRFPKTDVGYNAVFYYPEEGGIEELVKGFTRHVRDKIVLDSEVKEVVAREKVVVTGSGRAIRYKVLISSVPLRDLVDMVVDAPEEFKVLGRGLRATSVLCYNLGIRGEAIPGVHWIYFPEDLFPFYRVGIPTNFASHLAPKGYSSLYVEISFGDGERPEESLFGLVVEGLERLGIIRSEGDVVVKESVWIEKAYCIYDKGRREALGRIMPYLEENGIISIGRYGRWEYSSMQDAIIQGRDAGKKAVERICLGR